ncbi:MAG: secondary thiamine-phosphate synthase enzyme YjbQ [Terriglobia bacterium]
MDAANKKTEAKRSHAFQVETHARVEFKDITEQIQKFVSASGVEGGVCHVYVPHTTAAVLINENDDPALRSDFDEFLKRLAPRDDRYQHSDGNCDAHLKAGLVGCSKSLIIENGKLVLGRWQGVLFCEFDGPRRRDVRLKIISD